MKQYTHDFSRIDDIQLAKLIARDNSILPEIPPERFSSVHVTRAALKTQPLSIAYIPSKYWDDEIKIKIFESPVLKGYRDDSLLSPSVIKRLMDYNVENIKKIPHSLQTAEMASNAVDRNIVLLNDISPDLIKLVINKALSSTINNGGFTVIRNAYREKLSKALSSYNELILNKGDKLYAKPRKIIYHHRLSEIDPSRLREMAQRLKAYDAYRALTSTEEALQLMKDAGIKRQWLEGDLSL